MKIIIDQKRDKSLLNKKNYLMLLNRIINNCEGNCLIVANIALNHSMVDIELNNLFKKFSDYKLNHHIFHSF